MAVFTFSILQKLNGNNLIIKTKIMDKNNIAPPIPAELLKGEDMVKIRVYNESTLAYTRFEVCRELYDLIQEKVIKSLTSNVELQTFLQANQVTLDKYMYACVTEKMLNEAINEIAAK